MAGGGFHRLYLDLIWLQVGDWPGQRFYTALSITNLVTVVHERGVIYQEIRIVT